MLLKTKLMKLNIFSKEPHRTVFLSVVGSLVFVWLAIIFMSPLRLQTAEASLVFFFNSEGQRRMFQGEVIEGMSILDALRVSSEAGQIDFEFEIGSDQTIVKKLNGYSDDIVQGLIFYLNGLKIEESQINRIMIKPGDLIEVRFE